MTLNSQPDGKLLDTTDWHILRELQTDARLSYAEIGRRVGLSSPAVMERVRKLEDAGIIEGYRAQINVKKLGRPITGFLRIRTTYQREQALLDYVRTLPEVLQCHHIMGEDCYMIQFALESVSALEAFISNFHPYGETNTTIALSTVIEQRIIEPLNQPQEQQPAAKHKPDVPHLKEVKRA